MFRPVKPHNVSLEFELYPKQLQALTSGAQFVLYGGAAGGGKSHLMRVAMILHALQIAGLQCYLFRRHYQDLLNNHMEGPTGFRNLLQPLVAQKLCKITELEIEFPQVGSRIRLCHCQHEKNVWDYQGAEIHFLGLEEATQFSEFMIRFLLGRVRVPDSLPIPKSERKKWPKVLATSNPGGLSHSFWKQKFVLPYREEKARTRPSSTDSVYHVLPLSDGGWSASFIPAKLDDNPSIDKVQYAAALSGLKRKDLVEALLGGSWDVSLGAMFPELNEEKHLIPPFAIPDHWFKFRTFDWGSSAPFVVQWWAVSDGSMPLYPRNSLICYREWYGASQMDPTKGLGLSNRAVAEGIRQRTFDDELIQGTVTDSKPFHSQGGKTIAEEFEEHAVPLQMGDVSKGSRVNGWQLLRSRLIGHNGRPLIYFFDCCRETWRTLSQLQSDIRNPEDADTDGEDHAPDAVSLACKARPQTREAPKEEIPIEKEVWTFDRVLQRHLSRKRFEAQNVR